MAQPKNINNAILGVLESIDAKLDAGAERSQKLETDLAGMSSTGVVGASEWKEFSKFFGNMAKGISSLVKAAEKMSPKASKNLKNLLTNIGEGIKNFFEEVDRKDAEAFSTLISALGKYVLIFAISMVVAIPFLLLAPIGALLFGLTIRVLIWAMGTAKAQNKKSTDGLKAIMGLAKGVLLFSLAMMLYILVAPFVAIGVLVFGLTIRLLMLVLGVSGKNARKNIRAMNSILKLALGIILFALAMFIVSKMIIPILLGAVVFALAIWILSLGLKMLSSKRAKAGLMLMIGLTLSILLLALVVAFVGPLISWESLAKIGVMVVGFAVAFYVAGMFKQNIGMGAGAMILSAIPIILLAIAMAIWKSANITWMDIAMVGALVLGLGVVMALAGIPVVAGFIALGSAVMILAAVPLIIIAGALAIFKKTNWNKKDGTNLKDALGSVITGFLGGEMPGGILSSIKFAAKLAARTAFMFIAIPAYLLAAAALLPISIALLIFKKANFGKKDSKNLEFVMGSIISAFGLVGDKERQAKMGIWVNPWDLYMGTLALSRAGNTLASLASGIQAFANLSVPIYEYNEEKGELVVVEKRPMSEADFDKAAYGMAKVISSIAEPFAFVGKLDKGESSGNPLYDAVFGGGLIKRGVRSLQGAGDVLVGLAKGVKDFANLTISQWEMKEVDGKMEMVEISRTPMSEGDFTSATNNIRRVVSNVADVFAAVGKAESEGGWFFKNNYTKKGVAALAGSGQIISQLSIGLKNFANLTVSQYGMVKNKDGVLELKEISRKTMTNSDFNKATKNMRKIINVAAGIFGDVGEAQAKGTWFFANNYTQKGIEAVSGAGDVMVSLAKGIQSMANLTFPTYGVKRGKIVITGVTTITQGGLGKAGESIRSIITTSVSGITYAAMMISGNEKKMKLVYEHAPKISIALVDIAKGFSKAMKVGIDPTMLKPMAILMLCWKFTITALVRSAWQMGFAREQLPVLYEETPKMLKSLQQIAKEFNKVIKIGVDPGLVRVSWILTTSWMMVVNTFIKSARLVARFQAHLIILYKHIPIILFKLTSVTKGFKKSFLNFIDHRVPLRITMQMLTYTVSQFQWIGTMIALGILTMKVAYTHIPKVAKNLTIISKAFADWKKVGVTAKITDSFISWFEAIQMMFNPRKYRGLYQQSRLFGKFTKNATKLVQGAKSWELIAKGMNSTADGMQKYAVAVNSFDADKLQMVDSLMMSLAAISKRSYSMDQMGRNLGNGIERGFELLAEKIMTIIEIMMAAQGGGGGGLPGEDSGGGIPIPGTDYKVQNPFQKKDKGGGASATVIAAALKGAIRGLAGEIASKTLTVKSSGQGGESVKF